MSLKQQTTSLRSLPALGFSEGIVGLKKNEVKEVEITFSDEVKEEFRGKKAVYHLTLKEIKKKELPQLDDEFAKDVGEENLTSLKDKIEENLKKRDENKVKARMEDDAVALLIEASKIELPPLMVDRELDRALPRKEYSDLGDEEYAQKRSDSTEAAFTNSSLVMSASSRTSWRRAAEMRPTSFIPNSAAKIRATLRG